MRFLLTPKLRTPIIVLTVVILPLLVYQSSKLKDVASTIFLPSSTTTNSRSPSLYNDSTAPIFPSILDAPDGGQSDLCSNFPQQWLEKVQVVFKTGTGQSEKNEANLASVTSCIQNMIVVSDYPEQVGGRDFIDILATLPAPYSNHPDFAAYYTQQKARQDGKVGPSHDAWKLDRFKFLPMVNTAYEMRPNASWYVFLEADVYIFWDNLFRLLNQFNPKEKHYLGSAVPGSKGRWFAYGGAGIVISQGLMQSLVGDGTILSKRYQKMALNDCCGDAVLGYVILAKTGVRLTDLYPMFSGDYLPDLRIDKQCWCTPLISLHRMSVDSLRSLWRWERTRRPSQVCMTASLVNDSLSLQQKPLVFSDMVAYRQPLLQNTSFHDFWDNLSADMVPNDDAAIHSSLTCAEACERNATCLQYSYTRNECRMWPYIVHGHEVTKKDVEFVSGWDRQKMRDLGLSFADYAASGCETARWTEPIVH